MSSIPLPALAVKAPEQPDLLGQVGKMMSLKSMLGQQQIQQQEIQSKTQANTIQAQQIKDMQVVRDAFVKNNGDIDATIKDAGANGASPDALTKLQLHGLDVKSKALDLYTKQGDLAIKQADLAQGSHDTVVKAAPADRPAVYQQQLMGLHNAGVDISQLPPQYPGDKQFKLLGAVVQGHAKQMDEAKTVAETAKDKSAANASDAEANLKNMEAASGGTGPMADSRYRNIVMRQKAGMPPNTPEDANWAKAYEKQKTLTPVANFNLQNSSAANPEDVAWVASGKGKISDVIPMRAPASVRQAFISQVLKVNPDFKSYDNEVDKKIVEDLTSGGKSNTLLAYNTALKHADIFSKVADALDNGDSRALNSLGNTLGTQFGSDKATNFGIAKTLFADEFAKAATGANVGVTDREKAQELLSAASSPAQFKGAVATAKALLAGKRDAMMEQAKQGMQGKPDFGQGNSPDPAKPWEKYPVHQ